VTPIDTLPDEVLLAIFDVRLRIFDFGVGEDPTSKKSIEAWQSLVHVCRRWRSIVFGSPVRLNLQLVGTRKTPVRDTLDVWPPAMPLVIDDLFPVCLTGSLDNTIALLEHSHRVCQICMDVTSPELEEVSAAMQVPFPELTDLQFSSCDELVMAPVLPDSFLGSSAPRLRKLQLGSIPFPGLPRLLLSTTHLVELHLVNIPHAGYISPETMVNALSTLINLESLSLIFESPQSRPDAESRRPPPIRSVLPVLKYFAFNGLSEYLEDFVARVDTPLLNTLCVTPLNQFEFNTTPFIRFIDRTPKLKAFKKARVCFDRDAAWVDLSTTSGCGVLNMTVTCRGLEQQLSSLERVCASSLPPLSAAEDLYVCEAPTFRPDWQDMQDDFESTQWLDLLDLFRAVKNLYLSKDMAPGIVLALQETVIGGTAVLPTLQNIFLEELQSSGPIQEAIGQFVAARQVTSHPIAVSCWDRWRRGS
jgi:hypothetical protein